MDKKQQMFEAPKMEYVLWAALAISILGFNLFDAGFSEWGLGLAVTSPVVMGARRRRAINVQQAEVSDGWYWYFLPLWRNRMALSLFEGVYLSHEVRKAGRSYRDYYHLFLTGNAHQHLAEYRDPIVARGAGEALSKLLELPLHDGMDGAVRVRLHQELDVSLSEKVKGKNVVLPGLPNNSDLSIRQSSQGWQVMIPTEELPWWGYLLGFGIPSAIGIAAWVAGQAQFVMFVVVFSYPLLKFWLMLLFNHWPVHVSVNYSEMDVRHFPQRWKVSMDEVEELVIDGGSFLVIGDRTRHVIPTTMDSADARYLRDLIIYVAARSPSREP